MATDYTKCSIGFALGDAFDNLATAMFTVYGDKKVNFCPFCGSDQYLRQIKSGKGEEENKKKRYDAED